MAKKKSSTSSTRRRNAAAAKSDTKPTATAGQGGGGGGGGEGNLAVDRSNQEPDDRRSYGTHFFAHYIFVDFLGALVPGMVFSISMFVALIPPIYTLTQTFAPVIESRKSMITALTDILEKTKTTPSMIWIGVFLLSSMFSYVVGHLFYRRNLKAPDKASFERINKTANYTAKEKKENFGCETAEECEFPYPYFGHYLKKRGHDHLLPYVENWTASTVDLDDEDVSEATSNRDKRSKTHINRLKVLFEYRFPHKFGRIVRNEAHVRLATSTWYVCKALNTAAWLSIVIALLPWLIVNGRSPDATFWELLDWSVPVLWPSLILGFSYFAIISTEKFIHYQRLREAFFVLQFAAAAFDDDTGPQATISE